MKLLLHEYTLVQLLELFHAVVLCLDEVAHNTSLLFQLSFECVYSRVFMLGNPDGHTQRLQLEVGGRFPGVQVLPGGGLRIFKT